MGRGMSMIMTRPMDFPDKTISQRKWDVKLTIFPLNEDLSETYKSA
jgi:hypothetical protein